MIFAGFPQIFPDREESKFVPAQYVELSSGLDPAGDVAALQHCSTGRHNAVSQCHCSTGPIILTCCIKKSMQHCSTGPIIMTCCVTKSMQHCSTGPIIQTCCVKKSMHHCSTDPNIMTYCVTVSLRPHRLSLLQPVDQPPDN